MTALAIAPEHRAIVYVILQRLLPPDAEIRVYGSRATGRHVWRGSDLDPMVRAKERLSLDLCEVLAEAFSESLLPYMVDLHDWHRTSADVLALVAPDMAKLPMTADTAPGVME